MPTYMEQFKIGRAALAACLGIASVIVVTNLAVAQDSDRVERLRLPTQKSFLDPGSASSNQKGPSYVVDGMMSAPAYGPGDRFGGDRLPPMVGGGRSSLGTIKR